MQNEWRVARAANIMHERWNVKEKRKVPSYVLDGLCWLGLCHCHCSCQTHSPLSSHPCIGLGLDLPTLDWLALVEDDDLTMLHLSIHACMQPACHDHGWLALTNPLLVINIYYYYCPNKLEKVNKTNRFQPLFQLQYILHVRFVVNDRGLFTVGWFGVREKYCSSL